MKRLRFNLLQLFPAQNYTQPACHARRRWDSTFATCNQKRLEKVFTTQRKTFHPFGKGFHFRKQAFSATCIGLDRDWQSENERTDENGLAKNVSSRIGRRCFH